MKKQLIILTIILGIISFYSCNSNKNVTPNNSNTTPSVVDTNWYTLPDYSTYTAYYCLIKDSANTKACIRNNSGTFYLTEFKGMNSTKLRITDFKYTYIAKGVKTGIVIKTIDTLNTAIKYYNPPPTEKGELLKYDSKLYCHIYINF